MNWMKLNRPKAIIILNEYNAMNEVDFKQQIDRWKVNKFNKLNEDYVAIRKEVLENEYIANIISNNKYITSKKYEFDLLFGISLHEALSKRGFTERQGGSTQVWLYLITCVFPDLVRYRLQNENNEEETFVIKKIIENRLTRLYISRIWWYINLCLQLDNNGNPDYIQTKKVLTHCTTDTILQLVDRVGKSGYYLDFTRKLAKVLDGSKFFEQKDRELIKDVYRRLHQLNLIKINEIDPCLVTGEYEGYCLELLEEAKKVYATTIKQ